MQRNAYPSLGGKGQCFLGYFWTRKKFLEKRLLFILWTKSCLKRKSMANTMFEKKLHFPLWRSRVWSRLEAISFAVTGVNTEGLRSGSNYLEAAARSDVKRSQPNELDDVLFRFFLLLYIPAPAASGEVRNNLRDFVIRTRVKDPTANRATCWNVQGLPCL
ncbi:hypothetical protein NPIL_546191 [Nephila pilipes]|uniref:Uncharacterized protein n=1 Tax=Nephila pilipes TaxID=299642 RepID=A0A8X6N6M2_NEPPI|nr:hypothetical protein NPIL_546191 [Nephila pilipes]